LSGALGLAQGSAWLTEIWPPLAKAGFRAGRGLAVDDGHFVTLLLEVVGRGHAEQAGAEDDHAHFESLLRF
jgi:hypothetical protein